LSTRINPDEKEKHSPDIGYPYDYHTYLCPGIYYKKYLEAEE
jgi:hypothetical protein